MTGIIRAFVFWIFLCFFLLHGLASFSAPVSHQTSIHEQDLNHWIEQEQKAWHPWSDNQNIPVKPLGYSALSTTHEIHGFHPYWAADSYTQYDWSLLSTVAFFGLELEADGSIYNTHGWPWTGLVSMAHEHNTRVIITITNFSSTGLATLLANPAHRTTAITNILANVQLGGADGVNIDFENVPYSQRQTFVLFVEELAAGLHSILEVPYLSVATPAVDWAGSYQYAALASHCNHLMVMGYNYHYSGSPTTGPVAPLSGWGTFNVTWTIDDYLYWGVAPESILLGVPYYGYRWATASGEAASPTTEFGSAVTFQTAWPEGQTHGLIWDDAGQTNWYRYETDHWFQVWFENEVSLGHKYEFVKERSLAGVGIWALSYDGSRPELWSALYSAFQVNSTVPENSTWFTASRPAPNPTSAKVHVSYRLEQPSSLAIKVYDLQGRQVADLATHSLTKGMGSITWTPQGLPSGSYLIRFTTDRQDIFRRVTYIK